jgi:hypothetical protein
MLLGRSGHAPRRPEAAKKRGPEEERPVSEGTRAQGLQGSGSGERGIEEHSSSETNATTVENLKGPKGLLAPLLNLDILPSPESDTITLESGGSGNYQG